LFHPRELALFADDQPALRDFLAISADPDLQEAYGEEAGCLQALATTT
jgi:hypothetical protein